MKTCMDMYDRGVETRCYCVCFVYSYQVAVVILSKLPFLHICHFRKRTVELIHMCGNVFQLKINFLNCGNVSVKYFFKVLRNALW